MKAKEGRELAFGVVPSYRKYELFMARYEGMMEFFESAAKGHDSKNPLKVLDIGSGKGYLFHFAKHLPIEWTGIEFAGNRFEICKELGYKMYNFDLETTELPFDDGAFDLVVASHVFEHLENLDFAFNQAWRVLKAKGIMIIGLPMHIALAGWLMTALYRFRKKKIGGHCRFFTMSSLRKFLSGKNILDIRGFRLLSARKRFGWEDHYSFYRVNTAFGKMFPGFTPEINAVLRKE